MNKIFSVISCYLILTLAGHANAAGKVSLLTVDGQQLVFANTEQKAVNSPECVHSETKQQWAIALNTQAGISSYNILLTAVANNLNVTVVSAGDCLGNTGIERSQSVALSN